MAKLNPKFLAKLPPQRDLYYILSIWVVFTNTWSTFSWLYEVPAIIRRTDLWGLVGTLAYNYTFALLEALGIFIPFTLLALLIPTRWLHYVSFTLHACIVNGVVAYFILGPLLLTQPQERLVWILGLLALLGLAYILRGKPHVQEKLVGYLDNLTLLATLYLILDGISLAIVIARNVF